MEIDRQQLLLGLTDRLTQPASNPSIPLIEQHSTGPAGGRPAKQHRQQAAAHSPPSSANVTAPSATVPYDTHGCPVAPMSGKGHPTPCMKYATRSMVVHPHPMHISTDLFQRLWQELALPPGATRPQLSEQEVECLMRDRVSLLDGPW